MTRNTKRRSENEAERTITRCESELPKKQRVVGPLTELRERLRVAARGLELLRSRCGTETIPYPPECRPNVPLCQANRLALVSKEMIRLSTLHRRTSGYRFLEKSIEIDWEADNIISMPQNEGSLVERSSSPQAGHSSESISPEIIPGLAFFNAVEGRTGSSADPIIIPDDSNDRPFRFSIPANASPQVTIDDTSANDVKFEKSNGRIHNIGAHILMNDLLQSSGPIERSSEDDEDYETQQASLRKETASHAMPNCRAICTVFRKPSPSMQPDAAGNTDPNDDSGDDSDEDTNGIIGIDESLDQTFRKSRKARESVKLESDGPDPDSSATENSDHGEYDPSESDEEPVVFAGLRRPESAVKLARSSKGIHLPRVPDGRPRRLLPSKSPADHLMTVSMRGDIQNISYGHRALLSNLSLPAENNSYRVEDACRLGDHAVLAHSRGVHEIAIVRPAVNGERPERVFLSKNAHGADASRIEGISCIAPYRHQVSNAEPLEFITGGNDKRLVRWKVRQARKEKSQLVFRTSAYPLTATRLNSRPIAIIRPQSVDTVHASAGRRLWSFDIETGKGSSIRFSNDIIQLHAPTENDPNLLLAEVDHMYSQMQLLDLRSRTRAKPVLEFGRAASGTADDKFLAHSRKRRGDTTQRQFVRGYHDGKVFLWDYRSLNASRETNGIMIGDCKLPVWHTVFGKRKSEIWAFSQEVVNYFQL